MPNNCPGQSHSFYYVGQEANLTFAPGGYTISIFQAIYLTNILQRVRNKKTKEMS